MSNSFSNPFKGDILIVDDELDNLSLLATTLVNQGYKVRKAINGEMALLGAEAAPPDLILLDVRMPQMDGYEVCQQLRAKEKTRQIPVIFLTVLDEVTDKVRGFQVGGTDYLTKPFQAEEVVARVEHQIMIRRLQERLEQQNANLLEVNQQLLQANAQLLEEITERKQLEAEREQLLQSEQTANRAKDEFLAAVSHELRTPLTNMKMAIQMLRLATEPVQRDRYLNILETECQREIQLVNELLDLQRIESGAIPLNLEAIRLQDVLSAIAPAFVERAKANQQHFSLHIPEELPPIHSDANYLERIVSELLNNACKYTPTGGEICVLAHPLPPQTEASSAPSQIELVVNNTSLEIPPQELARIFDRFYRLHRHHPSVQAGTGLGLTLVKRLVELLQGQIQARCHNGQVSFAIALPKHPTSTMLQEA